MPTFIHADTEIYYEEHGSGFPLLLIAPGGMRSAVPLWDNAPWNPIEQLSDRYRVVAMDQRNAGRSRAPIRAGDGWQTYTDDQLALMDHLGEQRFHVAGMCIGGSFCMNLIATAPDRVASAVLFQTIGLKDNRDAFYAMFDGWADTLKPERPEVPDTVWEAMKHAMYDHDFVFTADEAFVARCDIPLLVLCGNDLYHPREVSLAIAEQAPRAELVEQWKEPEHQAAARARVEAFLAAHTPRSAQSAP